MTRVLTALVMFGALGVLAGPAQANKHHMHKPAGVKGVVLDSTCPGACAEPAPPPPAYTGTVTITVRRASDGALVASQETSDGHFRLRVKRGQYDVSAVPPNPPSCEPTPSSVCPANAERAAIVAPCLMGEMKRVQVRRHRMTRVELHVRNVCIV
ncbi:MAG TPA: hypothetical protein VLB79_08280 [Solirubrobacterales bacterium]|nr:hypothetical protein [Solirubrobacterales bacterium]